MQWSKEQLLQQVGDALFKVSKPTGEAAGRAAPARLPAARRRRGGALTRRALQQPPPLRRQPHELMPKVVLARPVCALWCE
jgi:hypothetical protein